MNVAGTINFIYAVYIVMEIKTVIIIIVFLGIRETGKWQRKEIHTYTNHLERERKFEKVIFILICILNHFQSHKCKCFRSIIMEKLYVVFQGILWSWFCVAKHQI